MSGFDNAMEVFKLLDKSNCRECYEPTCLAFAGAVFKGRKRLGECTHLSREVIEQFGDGEQAESESERTAAEYMAHLKKDIAATDLASAASASGGTFSEGMLTIKVLGKNVSIDSQGSIFTDIHANPRILVPLLNYVLKGSDKPLSGNWVPFRELPNGRAWNGLFGQQCEIPIKKIADTYPEFFEDLIRLFDGKQVENHYQSDISLVLRPLPKMPLLICYWLPEDGIESDLHLFFDASAEDHLNIESVYSIGAGMAMMFGKISQRHGMMNIRT